MLTSHTPSEFPVGLISPDQLLSRPQRIIDEKGHADYLNLPGVRSKLDPKEGKCIISVQAEQVRIPIPPDCDCLIKDVKVHTPSFIMKGVLDEPRARKSVVIDITRRRWMCKSCHKTVTQPLDFMAKGHYKMTRRLLEYIEVQSLIETTELSLAKETGVFVRTIREIREKFVEKLEKDVEFETPRVLGLDGVRADSRRRRVILTDIVAGFVLDLLKSGCKKSIANRLSEFPAPEKIEVVTIDMCKTLLAAVLKALPDAVIVIDRFHIIKMANKVMDKVRNRLFPRDKTKREPGQPSRPRPELFRMRHAKLSENHLEYMQYWFDQKPELQLAYELKEAFMAIFDEETYGDTLPRSKANAHKLYKQWNGKIPLGEEYTDLRKDFKSILTAMNNWSDYVLNYFDYKYTNAFTESMNRKIKDTLRDARGCNFETICARIVYGTYLRKQREADRAREINDVMPHSKRKPRQQPNAKGSGTSKGTSEGHGRSKLYDLPVAIQMALKFTD